MKKEIWFDRTVDDELLSTLSPDGSLRALVEFRNARQTIMDLQFRRPRRWTSRASLYAGLTRILDLEARITPGQEPAFRFLVEHTTHRAAVPEGSGWIDWQPRDALAHHWQDVLSYLQNREEWLQSQPAAHHVIEGKVHASMCSDEVVGYRVINREASPSFRDQATKVQITDRIAREMRRAIEAVPTPKPWLRYRPFGTSCDILAVDHECRLLVVEAKPAASTGGIVKGPIQARFYAGLIARWLEHDEEAPEILAKMLHQRIAVDLSNPSAATFQRDMPVVPVLAIGPGKVSKKGLAHAQELREALDELEDTEAGATERLEFWRLGSDGNIDSRI